MESSTEKAIFNCFEKAIISHEKQQAAVTNADDPPKSLEEELDHSRKLN